MLEELAFLFEDKELAEAAKDVAMKSSGMKSRSRAPLSLDWMTGLRTVL